MISKKVVESARFIRMPASSQNLYFHLVLNADDDGVVEAFNVMNLIRANEDDLRVLISKGFVQVLTEELVTFIVDWREQNKIRADRKVDSIYMRKEEIRMYYRIFVADMGKFRNRDCYEYVAEFADRELAEKYIRWMYKCKRFLRKDIIVAETDCSEIDLHEGRVIKVLNVMGEFLPVDEYDIQ